jgi:hypothetical protein
MPLKPCVTPPGGGVGAQQNVGVGRGGLALALLTVAVVKAPIMALKQKEVIINERNFIISLLERHVRRSELRQTYEGQNYDKRTKVVSSILECNFSNVKAIFIFIY